ncbi:MAG: phenylalanine--tRNA ligase subunit beta [Gammaproteobacteria bacterium]
MKFSEQWLREWVDPQVSTGELVEQLTMAGLEVDSVEPLGEGLQDLLVGEVVSVEAHPDADKLRVCRVSIGQGEPLQVVCGAPNVRAGGRYPLVPVGATMPGGMKITNSKLRGVESHGMLCSARELGLSEEHEGLMVLPDDAFAGQRLADLLGLDDSVIDIDLTPNRGDCLGIEGIAREVGALTRSPVISIRIDAMPPTIMDSFDVEVQTPAACPRYLGRVIRAIDARAETPLWMQERLRRSGMRSLGPVVDVTNYVLLELGQPMHAFDLACLSQGIRVRYAGKGEELVLLDERRISLDEQTLVIADHDKPLAIAGVMGGIDSGVQENTTDLFLECAFFTPEAVAGCARRYAMHTDSAHRFERGVDPALQTRALQRATNLLLEIAGGQAGPVIEVMSAGHLPGRTPISLRSERIKRVLGMAPADHEVVDILKRLGMKVTEVPDGWEVLSPGFRFDIEIEADLIEELGRIYGYDRLPSVPLTGGLEMRPVAETTRDIGGIADVLVARGYREAVTYSFVDPELQGLTNPGMTAVRLANPISSAMAEMRTSLWPGLLQAVQHNLNRQKTRVRFFEHGLRFYSAGGVIRQDVMIAAIATGPLLPEHWSSQDEPVGFYDLKQDVEAIIQNSRDVEIEFVAAEHAALHPGQSAKIIAAGAQLGWLGRIHPGLAAACDISMDACLFELSYDLISRSRLPQFMEISRYPSIRRDLAIVVDEHVQAQAVIDVVRESAGALLQDMVIFDVYQGKGIESGRKSIAFGLILQDSSRTLIEEDIETVVGRVTAQLGKVIGATLRE